MAWDRIAADRFARPGDVAGLATAMHAALAIPPQVVPTFPPPPLYQKVVTAPPALRHKARR